MAIEIKVPDIGADEVEITEILVKVGDKVEAEQTLITVEGDKASMEVPAPFAGTVKEIKVNVGDKVSTGSLGRFNTGFGQRVEQGRFPDVGQTDDTAFESHDLNHLNILIINLLLLTDCRNGNNFAYYTRHSAKMPQTTTYCALKACNRFVALVKPSVNHISVQRAASSMASSINFCSLTGGLPNTKPTTLFLSPG